MPLGRSAHARVDHADLPGIEAPAPAGWNLNDNGFWQLGPDDDWHITTDGSRITIWDNDDSPSERVVISSTRVTVLDGDAMQLFNLDVTNKTLYVTPGGFPAFTIYGDGSVHIKTGTTILADL